MRMASKRMASVRSASVRMALVRLASVRLASARMAPVRLASKRMAPVRLALARLAFLPSFPCDSSHFRWSSRIFANYSVDTSLRLKSSDGCS